METVNEYTLALKELDTLLEKVVNILPDGGVILLQGDLAAGKTTFVQQFARFLGIEEGVTSPTFSLQHRYGNQLYHYDIYNKGIENFLELGLFEELEKEGYHCIEWADEKMKQLLLKIGLAMITIEIEKQPNSRLYRIRYA